MLDASALMIAHHVSHRNQVTHAQVVCSIDSVAYVKLTTICRKKQKQNMLGINDIKYLKHKLLPKLQKI